MKFEDFKECGSEAATKVSRFLNAERNSTQKKTTHYGFVIKSVLMSEVETLQLKHLEPKAKVAGFS